MRSLPEVLRPFTRVWFRYEIRGLERIPEPPCLFVGNHSGLGVAEVVCMSAAWEERFGDTRPIHGLAHDFLFRVPLLRRACRAIGGIPASPENAREALGEWGHDLIVFPGGEVDACRPFWQTREVVFGDRKGYAKLALELGVPIVPVATAGSHLTYLMLPGGELLSRALSLKKLLRVERVPLPAGVVLGAAALAVDATLGAALLALGAVPTPTTITTEVLPAIRFEPGTSVDDVHSLVHGTLRRAVKSLEPGRGPRRRRAVKLARA